MNLSPVRFFLKSTKQHMAAPPHDHAWDISILSKGTFLMDLKKTSRGYPYIEYECVYIYIYIYIHNIDTKMNSISCNLRKHPPVLSKKKSKCAIPRYRFVAKIVKSVLLRCFKAISVKTPPNLTRSPGGTEDNETNEESKKRWDSTMSPKKSEQ